MHGHPTDAGDIRDGVVDGEERSTVREGAFHGCVESVGFVLVSFDTVGDFFGRVAVEVVCLALHGSEATPCYVWYFVFGILWLI
jgi:hypothetical protein